MIVRRLVTAIHTCHSHINVTLVIINESMINPLHVNVAQMALLAANSIYTNNFFFSPCCCVDSNSRNIRLLDPLQSRCVADDRICISLAYTYIYLSPNPSPKPNNLFII